MTSFLPVRGDFPVYTFVNNDPQYRRRVFRIWRNEQLTKRMREDMAARGQYLNGRDNQ